MGITDYGIGPNGAYEYATNESIGIVTITSLSTRNSGGSTDMTFQLNVNLAFTNNDVEYVYWIQDVAYIDTSSKQINFLDNVWNSSAPSADMNASAISGNGTVDTSKAGSFYYYIADETLPGNNIPLTYPATITFNVTSRVNSSDEPTVSFAYDDGYGLITYDTVTFKTAQGLTSLTGFEVNGFNYNPTGLFYDSELILGGPGDGSQTTDLKSDVQLQLEYWNGHNYQMVANAYNFGSDTAEGISNVLAQFSHNPETGTISAEIQPGAGQLNKLYDQSQIAIINITSPLTSGTLHVTNASNPTATAQQYPFVNGEVTITLYPGYYKLQLYNQTGQIFDQGNFAFNAGQNLSLQTPFNAFTHNTAVISVATDETVIGQGLTGNITVQVVDNGQHAETFNVTVYANTTVIGTQQVINLNTTDTATLTFLWNTTSLPNGNYTISAYASPVPGENDVTDNNLTGGWVIVSIIGDITGPSGWPDGRIDNRDLGLVARNFLQTVPPADPNWDLNGDLKIDMRDISIIAKNFGQHLP